MSEENRSELLGKRAKDTLSGWEGVVTGHCQHLTGCDTVCLGGGLDKDGKPREGQWFDSNRIQVVDGKGWSPGQPQETERKGACAPLPSIR